MKLTVASPEKFAPDFRLIPDCIKDETVKWVKDPIEAVKDADFIYTEYMGQHGFLS